MPSPARLALAALALCIGAFSLPASAQQVLLAPGKSVVVIDATDPSMRVVITAPEHEPLDLNNFFGSANPKEGVLALVAHQHMARLRQAGEGAMRIGAQALPAAGSGTMIDEGVVALQEGKYVLIQGILSKPRNGAR